MLKKKVKPSSIVAFAIYLVIGGLLAISFPDSSYRAVEIELFTALLISYFVVLGLVVIAIAFFDLYVFEPFSIITAIYVGIFILRPFQDLFSHDVSYGGKNLLAYGVKSTVLFTVGFIAFYFGYFCKKNTRKKTPRLFVKTTDYTLSLLVTMWAIFFVFCLICQFSQGFSVRYIFSLGTSGDRDITGNNSLLLFLSNFATSLLVVWLMIVIHVKNNAVRIIITVLTAVYLIMRNSRWLVLIMLLAPIVYYYVKRRRSPKMAYMLTAGFTALVLFAWMQLNRYNIAMGRAVTGFGEEGLTFSLLMSPFDSDLTTYTTFYGMIGNFPGTFPFMFGKTFLYMFVLFVPRIFWPTKPDNPVRDMIEHSLGPLARINGRAVANIGEYYANFGIVGIILLMFLFGFIVSKLKPLYEEASDNRLMLYSVLYPLMFQWTARGNFSSNIYYTLFAFIPIVVLYIAQYNIPARRK